MKRLLLVIGVVAACGGGHGAHVDGGSGGGGGGGGGVPVSFGAPAVVFMVEYNTADVYRFADLDGDGDYNEAGERTLFAHNGAVLALDGRTALQVVPANGVSQIMWLEDMNGNGDALDPGESRVWFSGSGPGGALQGAVQLVLAPDGSIFAMDHEQPSPLIYRLHDDNGDGSVDDPGEATLVSMLAAPMTAMTVDGFGFVWLSDGTDLYRTMNGTTTKVVDHADVLAQLGCTTNATKLVRLKDGSVAFAAASSMIDHPEVLLAVRDTAPDHQITIDEVQTVWSSAEVGYAGNFDDLHATEDGSVFLLKNGEIMGDVTVPTMYRLNDGNGNGTFLDDGETYAVYDPYFAIMNGQQQLNGFSAVTGSTK